ncbi:MAG: ribosome silencing factor [Candidatus Zixiibacteriota bacterium]
MTAGKLAREKKAFSVRILDLRKRSSVTDYFVICSVDAEVQARAVADHITDRLREQQIRPWQTEGYRGTGWILVDFIDVVVHIFLPRTRDFYALEKLWGDAPCRELPED